MGLIALVTSTGNTNSTRLRLVQFHALLVPVTHAINTHITLSTVLLTILITYLIYSAYIIFLYIRCGIILLVVIFLINCAYTGKHLRVVTGPNLVTIAAAPLLSGLHIRGIYMGGAIHTDDLQTTAASSDSVTEQDKVIKSFAADFCLRLNTSKFEAVKISPYSHETAVIQIGDSTISTSKTSKCLGVWWNSSLSAQHSVTENVNKARKAFFALGRLGAFQGDLNPLSSCTIFETCIILVLLYGSETWLLDSTSLNTLESLYQSSTPNLLSV